jgi:ABC-type Na+ efflux pump permease subunit
MKGRASRVSIVGSIVAKDLREFSRNRFWFLAMVIGLAVMTVVFWLIPVEHPRLRLKVGICPQRLAGAANTTLGLAKLGRFGEQGASLAKAVEFVPFADEDELRAVVSGELANGWDDMSAAVVFPDDFVGAVRNGETPTVSLYLDRGLPDEMKSSLAALIRETAPALRAVAAGEPLGRSLPVSLPDLNTVTLGVDLQGGHIPPGLLVRNLMVASILAFGAVMLAGLIATEFERRTMAALLVTPVGVGDVIAAKGVTGVILCAGQVLVYMLATLRFEENWPLSMLLLLLGAIMMSAIGMIAGTAGKGFADTLVWALLLTVPLALPLLSHAGTPSLFVKALPTYAITEAFINLTLYRRGWNHLAPYLCAALAWDVALFGLACVVLKRKVGAR